MIRSRLVPKESTYAFKEFGVRELAVSIKNQGQDFPGNPMVKSPMQGTWVPSLGWEDPLEEGMVTYSSILA